jgi:hypothetical protein
MEQGGDIRPAEKATNLQTHLTVQLAVDHPGHVYLFWLYAHYFKFKNRELH